ncbi:TIR-like protein FxsC [Sphaerisporangium sp. NPDC005288]|uniref:TIR-like protein FxsC n=1 Tax=Sphaerisporangium rhizosphaerae TaxID=2269375 RepID=A0ABW2P7Z7_9ACTN
MADGSFSGDGLGGPFFFLSYRHIGPTDSGEQDGHVVEFYRDLCRHIMQLTDHPDGVPAGFIDRTILGGNRWNADIMHALATCKVFVPLYQPKYFTSEFCGKEWDAFARRVELHRNERYYPFTAILPVLWAPVDMNHLPKVASELQVRHPEPGGDCLYRLAIMKDFHKGYVSATFEIATAIVDVATSTRLAPCDPAVFTNLRNVFDEAQC